MKKLKDRWFTEERFYTYNEVLKCFQTNGSLSKIKGLDQIDGYYDLRGIALPVSDPVVSRGTFITKQFVLDNVDLSHATIVESQWENCTFTNCRFTSVKADHSSFWACYFENCVFEKAQLNDVLMNGTLKSDSGYFRSVQFINSNLRGTVYGNTLFDRCRFLECKLNKVDFSASRFVDCRFTGKLDEVCFRGLPPVDRKLFPDRVILPNEMLNIDFSQSELESVMFLDAIDLSRCKFPASDDYIVIKNNRNMIFEQVRRIIDAEWSGANKNIGITLIDQYYLSSKAINNKGEVVDRQYLLKTNFGFGEAFFQLIKKVSDEIDR